MADIVTQRNIGALIKPIQSVRPQAASAAVNGAGVIDRAAHGMPLSCSLHMALGAVTGTPTALAPTAKIQDSDDGSTFADYKPDGTNVATSAALSAADTENDTPVDLSAARRYLRAVFTPTFTGGTSPTVETCVTIILGGQEALPAA